MYHLREMLRAKSPLARVSESFTWLCLRALRDTAVIHLWKVFDTQRDAHSLRWFVRTHSVLDAAAALADLDRLSKSHDDVRRLADLRHQLFAHRSQQSTARGSAALLEANNLTEAEFSTLVQDATRILKRHHGSHLFKEVSHSAAEAVGELIDLDVYLDGTYRGLGGIERFEFVLDGNLNGLT
jgi:hypothetical protein